MKELEKRLQALESLAKEKEKLRRSHAPFILYRPWSLLLDQHNVLYYPEGLYQQPQKEGPFKFSDFCDLLRTYSDQTRLDISLGECSEWLFAFHHYSEQSQMYTQEQLERFKEKDLTNYPELEYLTTTEGCKMLNTLLRIPQVFSVRVKDYLDAIKEA
ncbi:MAG: hypothetical protein IJX37_01435 [Oscillospiraceae bacterium]|nr:hypothetical protein [Oscillospiraceae bacterium]